MGPPWRHEGNDMTPTEIAADLHDLSAQMLEVATKMDYYGGPDEYASHATELSAAAAVVQQWVEGIEATITPEQGETAPR